MQSSFDVKYKGTGDSAVLAGECTDTASLSCVFGVSDEGKPGQDYLVYVVAKAFNRARESAPTTSAANTSE